MYSDRTIHYTVSVSVPQTVYLKHIKNAKLYFVEFLRREMTSDSTNYHRKYRPIYSVKFSASSGDQLEYNSSQGASGSD